MSADNYKIDINSEVRVTPLNTTNTALLTVSFCVLE